MKFSHLIPILRSFDDAKAREFYCGYLGFKVDFEHRFHDGAPLYMQVSREGVRLHLSEHHGDATPGSAVRIEAEGIEELHAELVAKTIGSRGPASSISRGATAKSSSQIPPATESSSRSPSSVIALPEATQGKSLEH